MGLRSRGRKHKRRGLKRRLRDECGNSGSSRTEDAGVHQLSVGESGLTGLSRLVLP